MPGRGLAETVEAWTEEPVGLFGRCADGRREVGRMAALWVGIMPVALLLFVFDHMMRRAYARRHR